VTLLLFHPRIAARSCDDCRAWLYDETGARVLRAGQPVARPANTPTPCSACPKIPASAPVRTSVHAIELSERNRAAYSHYLGCLATRAFPDDPIVRRNASVIHQVREMHAQLHQDRLIHLLGGKISG
jgi:hypothetical protein